MDYYTNWFHDIKQTSVADSGHVGRSSRKQQEGGKAGSERFGVRALRAKPPGTNLLLASRGNIFGFGPPRTKMRSRSPAPSRLPAFLFSRKVLGPSFQHDSSPKRSLSFALRRHGGFCK
jgi:hypothetical protein